MTTQDLLSVHLNAELQCLSVKKKRVDPNTPRNFNEACKFQDGDNQLIVCSMHFLNAGLTINVPIK